MTGAAWPTIGAVKLTGAEMAGDTVIIGSAIATAQIIDATFAKLPSLF